MKPLKSLLILPGIVLGLTMLFFTKCQNDTTTVGIPYNKDSAQVHFIPIGEATMLTSNFKQGKMELSRQLKNPTYLNSSFNLPLAEKFNRDAIAALLNQDGTKGIRIYLGQDKEGQVKMVIVGVDERGNDITGNEKSAGTEKALVLEAGQRCPTLCSLQSPLN